MFFSIKFYAKSIWDGAYSGNTTAIKDTWNKIQILLWHVLVRSIHTEVSYASQYLVRYAVAVHLEVKMADTLSFTAKVDMVDFWV